MKHTALLELVVGHSFYRSERCPDFAIAPSVETARLLRNHRCLWRSGACGLRVMTAQDSGSLQPFLPLAAGTVLQFHLVLQNNDFPLFTDLSSVNALPAPLFRNAVLPAGQGGELTLTDGGPSALPRGVFAQIAIELDGHGLGAAAPQFRASFQAKQARWAYYCITDLPLAGGDLAITDTAPGGLSVLLFSDSNRTNLDENADLADPIAVQYTGQFPGMRCVRIISDDAVVCREEPRKYLELRRGADRLIGPLPNPSVRNIVRMAAPHLPQDLLFQIVQYKTRPFA